MSLNFLEKKRTSKELKSNFELLGKSSKEVAVALGTNEDKINDILNLKNAKMEDPWILKNYMDTEIRKNGKEPIKYSKLVGNHENYYFLDIDYINGKKIE